MTRDTSSAGFFEAKYATDPDPWSFETDVYEKMRYQTILDALDRRSYSRAFEPGCSVGVLTELLAPRCDSLEALDASATAVARAKRRCQRFPRVNISVGVLPADLPEGKFDLIVFSEIGYYFDKIDLAKLIDSILHHLCSKSVLLAAHWLGKSPDHMLNGDEVHEIIGLHKGLERTLSYRYQESARARFRLDRWVKT